MYDRTTVRPTVQGATFSMRGQLYHGHYLIISPLHGHGEVANENPLILPRDVREKKMRAPLLGLPKSIYYVKSVFTCCATSYAATKTHGKFSSTKVI